MGAGSVCSVHNNPNRRTKTGRHMDKLFDRAFSRAHGSVDAVVGAAAAAPKQEVASREERLRTLVTPMTSEDVVARIGLAFRDGDYYRHVRGAHRQGLQPSRPATRAAAKFGGTGKPGSGTPAVRRHTHPVHPPHIHT